MTFDWMQPKVNPSFAKKLTTRFQEAALVELEQRAKILHNLHFPKAQTTKKLQARVAWEFELSKIPAFAKKIPAIVDKIYGKA